MVNVLLVQTKKIVKHVQKQKINAPNVNLIIIHQVLVVPHVQQFLVVKLVVKLNKNVQNVHLAII